MAGAGNKEILCSFGVHVDAIADWSQTTTIEQAPIDHGHGFFSVEIGLPRLLDLFHKYSLPATWFIPGHAVLSFPNQMQMVADAGHEIGLHGYAHGNAAALTFDQEEAVLRRSIELVANFCGTAPRGFVAPWWEFSHETVQMLLRNGILYDHTRAANDFQKR